MLKYVGKGVSKIVLDSVGNVLMLYIDTNHYQYLYLYIPSGNDCMFFYNYSENIISTSVCRFDFV